MTLANTRSSTCLTHLVALLIVKGQEAAQHADDRRRVAQEEEQARTAPAPGRAPGPRVRPAAAPTRWPAATPVAGPASRRVSDSRSGARNGTCDCTHPHNATIRSGGVADTAPCRAVDRLRAFTDQRVHQQPHRQRPAAPARSARTRRRRASARCARPARRNSGWTLTASTPAHPSGTRNGCTTRKTR